MTNLTIQLSFDFDLTIDGLYSAIDFLEYTIDKGQAVAALRVYNQIFAAIIHCHENDIFAPTARSNLSCCLLSFQRAVLTLNGV